MIETGNIPIENTPLIKEGNGHHEGNGKNEMGDFRIQIKNFEDTLRRYEDTFYKYQATIKRSDEIAKKSFKDLTANLDTIIKSNEIVHPMMRNYIEEHCRPCWVIRLIESLVECMKGCCCK